MLCMKNKKHYFWNEPNTQDTQEDGTFDLTEIMNNMTEMLFRTETICINDKCMSQQYFPDNYEYCRTSDAAHIVLNK